MRRIREAEIRRYWNPDHDEQVADAWADFEDEIAKINAEVKAEFKAELDALEKERARIARASGKATKTANELFARMRQRLEERTPEFEQPEISFEADEDPDPLFDSQRDYLDQVAAYKRFQGKSAPVDNGENEIT